jgi:hypothetical protein
MDGIIFGRSSTSNALLVYNPRNKQYYEPDSYRIGSYCLPSMVYHDIKYDGGLFCQLLRDKNPPVEEPHPPSTCIEQVNPTFNRLLTRMLMDIPFPSPLSDPPLPPSYTIIFDNGTSASTPSWRWRTSFQSHRLLLPQPTPRPVPSCHHFYSSIPKSPTSMTASTTRGTSQKLMGSTNFHSNSTSTSAKRNGVFPCSPTSPHGSTFDLVASFVSAVNLHCNCPPTPLKALADSHPYHEVWLKIYEEEIEGIQSMNTYCKITLGEYQALCEKGAPKAIPTMCILRIKKDENLLPLHAKSHIVVLGNHKDQVLSKRNQFAPVVCQDSLCLLVSLAIQKRCPLCQGDCTNAFCQGVLPKDKITLVRPPHGAPDVEPNKYWLLQRTLYGLCHSPRHWYDKINAILCSFGLRPSLMDPCLYLRFI